MSNPQPIKDYLAAVEALKGNRWEEASRLLASAIGADGDTPIMRENIAKLLTPHTMANYGILKLVASEVSKRSSEDG